MKKKTMKHVMKENSLHTKKQFGQNFLSDEGILENIVEEAQLLPEDMVLEIGPGMGTLTEKIAQKAKKVISVEIDHTMVAYLEREIVSKHDNIQVVDGDFLKLDLKEFLNEHFGNQKVTVIANIPYYITSPIIMALLEQKERFQKIVLMVQEEVADRLESLPGKKSYGSLTLAVQYQADVRKAFRVPAMFFTPPPKVDSAVVVLEGHSRYEKSDISEKLLFHLIRKAFSTRRKTLLNCLCGDGEYKKEQITLIIHQMGLDERIRGEALSLGQFMELAKQMGNVTNS